MPVESRRVDFAFTSRRNTVPNQHVLTVDSVTFQIFARAPVPGQSKTRLIPLLGKEGAARLQEAMTLHILNICRQSPTRRVELWCAPDISHPFLQLCAQRFGVTLRVQQGADLGARMHYALADAVQNGCSVAVLIGTDVPTLTSADLNAAAAALRSGHDAVIAPALDGGYVLIGVTRTAPALFQGIDWGGSKVLGQTRARLRELGYRWQELRTHRDIDHPEDWAWLVARDPAWARRLQTDNTV